MAKRRYSLGKIIAKLREAEVLLSQGKTVPQASRTLEISEQVYCTRSLEASTQACKCTGAAVARGVFVSVSVGGRGGGMGQAFGRGSRSGAGAGGQRPY